jgi:hypothetical protein
LVSNRRAAQAGQRANARNNVAKPSKRVGEDTVSGGREPLLRIENVSVRFGGVRALDGVTCEVNAGEICGLIGPNGGQDHAVQLHHAALSGRQRLDLICGQAHRRRAVARDHFRSALRGHSRTSIYPT